MTRTKQVLLLSVTLVALFAVALGVVFLLDRGPDGPPSPARGTEVDLGPVIATVDGRPVYLGEARARVEGLTSLHGDVAAVLGEDWPDEVLRSLVGDQVVRAEADARGIEVTDADVQSSVARIQEQIPEDATLDDWLAENGMTYGELVRRIRLQLIGSRVYLAVTRDVSVSGAEIRDYYRDNRQDFQATDGHVSPLLEVRREIRETLLKQARDAEYADWLDAQERAADVVVVIEDWWKDLT